MSDVTVVEVHRRPSGLAKVSQVIDYLFWLLYTMLFLRLALVFFAANTWVGFVQFVQNVTNPFYAPFRGIVNSPAVDDAGHTLAVPILIAIACYALLHFAINKLLLVIGSRQTVVR